MNVAMFCGIAAEKHRFDSPISFSLDDGNTHKEDVCKAHEYLVNSGERIGRLCFGSDENDCWLQAADVVSWCVRRKLANLGFPNGFEPLEGLFDKHHAEIRYAETWMTSVADGLQEKANEITG